MANLGDISKINLPNGNVVNIKDTTARTNITFVASQGRKNVLKFDSVGDGDYSGITYTVNDDGTVRASGTASAISYLYLKINGSRVDAKEYTNGQFILSGCPSGGGSNTYSLYAAKGNYAKFDYGDGVTLTPTTETQVFIVLRVEKNQTVDIVFKPMIRLVGTDSTFEPYSFPNTKITPELIELVDSGAKNVFNEPVITTGSAGEINITDNGDGTFTLNTSGATTVNSGVRIGWFTGKQGVTYAVSNYSSLCQLRVRYGSDIILDTSGGANIFVAPSNARAELIWYVPRGTTLTNYVLKPMICTKAAWDVSQKFVPYRPTYAETVAQVAENETNISKFDQKTISPATVNNKKVFTIPIDTQAALIPFSVGGDSTISDSALLAYNGLYDTKSVKIIDNITSASVSAVESAVYDNGTIVVTMAGNKVYKAVYRIL